MMNKKGDFDIYVKIIIGIIAAAIMFGIIRLALTPQ